MKENNNNTIYKYSQLYDILLEKILANEWKANDKMPTERELSIRYNVSRVTVRDTLNRLAQAGYIYRIQGKGTFVSVRKIEKKLTKLYTLRKRFEEKGVVHEVKTLQFEVISPSDDIREKLEIIENEDVYKLIRCFYADHIPYAIEISFVPTGPYPDLSANDIEKQGLYKSMQMYNIIPEHASENIFAVKLTNEDALILGLKPQDIAIQIERTTHSNNLIIEFTTSLIKTEYFYYTSELSST